MPVDFSLTDEQREIQALAREFARNEIRPVAAEYDAREDVPWPVLEKAARIGLLSYGLPEEYGGGHNHSTPTRMTRLGRCPPRTLRQLH